MQFLFYCIFFFVYCFLYFVQTTTAAAAYNNNVKRVHLYRAVYTVVVHGFYTVFTRPLSARRVYLKKLIVPTYFFARLVGVYYTAVVVVVVVVALSSGVAKTASRAICAVCVVFRTCQRFSIVRPFTIIIIRVPNRYYTLHCVRLVNFILGFFFFFFCAVPSCDESRRRLWCACVRRRGGRPLLS